MNGLIGIVQHNEPETIDYNQQEILILRSRKTRFVIFEADGRYYLSMLGRRSLVNAVLHLISEELETLGFTIDEVSITHSDFEDIEEDLIDKLRTTTIRGYPSPTIDAKDIRGFGFEKAREYEREKNEGTIHGQRFETESVSDTSKTVQISSDGLVRCYSNIRLSTYLHMLSQYIVPHISQYQSSLYTFETDESNIQANNNTDD